MSGERAWTPGDLVVAIPMSQCIYGSHAPADDVCPDETGKIYRVIATGIWWDGRQTIAIGLNIAPDGDCWCGGCYRKLNDEPDNAELIERIKKCRPIKTGVPA